MTKYIKEREKLKVGYRQRQQLRAFRSWLRSTDGTKTLKDWCEEYGVTVQGAYKLIEKKGLMEKAIARTEIETEMTLATVVKRLHERAQEDTETTGNLIKIGEFSAKLKHGGYRRAGGDSKPQVAIQINLPPGLEKKETRAKIVRDADKALGEDLL